MTDPKFPSEEQGGYDPIPTHPQPLSPGRTAVNPEDEPGIDELPNNEGAIPMEQDDGRANTVAREPDAGAVILDEGLHAAERQLDPVCREQGQIVVVHRTRTYPKRPLT